MALTMAGPRLWILIKAFFFWAVGFYEKRSPFTRTGSIRSNLPLTASSSTINPNQHDVPLRDFAMGDGYDTIKDSHSELGAAVDLIRGVWNLLQIGRISLSTKHSLNYQGQRSSKIRRFWNNFLQQPVDILVSLLISAALIGLFVAQSTGSILSASIVSDTTALVLSDKCDLGNFSPSRNSRALAYVKKCYHTRLGAEGCNDFYNQSITYTEKTNQTCPFLDQTCVLGKDSAIAFDTGFIDGKFLGINAAKRYQFRRKSLCAPLWDGDLSKEGTLEGSSNPEALSEGLAWE